MEVKDLGKELLGCVDLEKAAGIIVDLVIDEAKKLAADSSNKIDDAAVAILVPVLEPKAKEAIKALIAKIKA